MKSEILNLEGGGDTKKADSSGSCALGTIVSAITLTAALIY